MKKLPCWLFLFCVVGSPAAKAQVDTSSYFPLGLWAIWIDNTRAPFGDTNPVPLSNDQWNTEKNNWSTINANYMVYWYPDSLEEEIMNRTESLGYKLDISRYPVHKLLYDSKPPFSSTTLSPWNRADGMR